MQCNVTFVETNLHKNLLKKKISEKLESIVILQVNTEVQHSICNLRFNVPKEIPVVFHSGSNFDCHREHTEKYKTFSIPVEKEI